MPYTERWFTELQSEPDVEPSLRKRLAEFLGHPAIVIVGEPGSGKTRTFQREGSKPGARCVRVGDFISLRSEDHRGTTLRLDGLDEYRGRSQDGRTLLDRVRERLDELGRPRFRLSCRAADWHGSSDLRDLRSVSPDGTVLALRLEPLDEEQILTVAADFHPSPKSFVGEAEARGLHELLANPETLRLTAEVVLREGQWPESHEALYTKACAILVEESNPDHARLHFPPLRDQDLLDVAGQLCAVQLCGGS
jgi:hypothetical protein